MHRLFKNSASRRLSDFVRPIILAKPVNAKYRNASADDFLTAMLAMKKELNGIENNSQV
jgi:hypothetical protein